MMPGIQFSLTVKQDGVYVRYRPSIKSSVKSKRIESVKDFIGFIKRKARQAQCDPDDLIVICSSTMDFPEEETKDKAVIKLAHDLR